jgi:hypothetical protein
MNNIVNIVDEHKVIVVCPTYNRSKFLPYLIHQFSYQTYPQHLLYMIILDDSDISNQDLFSNLDDSLKSRIRYEYIHERKTIGAKRNMLNYMAQSMNPKYIVCFDDDDYYPPDRVSYCVSILSKYGYLIGGSSAYPIYYTNTGDICLSGPYINKYMRGHASNGTLIYDVKYLENHSYDDNDVKAEERKFLRNYNINLVQIPYEHVILCIAHNNNTIDKRNLRVKKLDVHLNNIVKDELLLNFYTSLK